MDNQFDLICLLGGQPGSNNLKNDQRRVKLLKKMQDQGKYISAICAAPKISPAILRLNLNLRRILTIEL
jgi:protein deglycase